MARIGELDRCGNPRCTQTGIAVHRTSGGKLSAKCHRCAWEVWTSLGTKAHRDLEALTTLDADDAPAPAPAAPIPPKSKKPEPAAPAPRVSSAFDLSKL